jgi:hypothetical protein
MHVHIYLWLNRMSSCKVLWQNDHPNSLTFISKCCYRPKDLQDLEEKHSGKHIYFPFHLTALYDSMQIEPTGATSTNLLIKKSGVNKFRYCF